MEELCKVKSSKLTNLEYEIQFFGCSSEDVFESMIDIINATIDDNVNNLILMLKKQYQDADETAIKNFKIQLKNMYKTALETNLQEYEKSVKEIFAIPPATLLPEDQVQLKQYSRVELEEVDKEIKSKIQHLEKTMIMEANLKEYIQQTKEILSKVNSEVSQLKIQEN